MRLSTIHGVCLNGKVCEFISKEDTMVGIQASGLIVNWECSLKMGYYKRGPCILMRWSYSLDLGSQPWWYWHWFSVSTWYPDNRHRQRCLKRDICFKKCMLRTKLNRSEDRGAVQDLYSEVPGKQVWTYPGVGLGSCMDGAMTRILYRGIQDPVHGDGVVALYRNLLIYWIRMTVTTGNCCNIVTIDL